MRVTKIGIWVVILSSIEGCNPERLPKRDYVEWVNDYSHGLHRRKQVGEYVFDLQYKPIDYILLRERNISTQNGRQYEQERKDLSGMQYFNLKISVADKNADLLKHGLTNEQEYYKRLNYYSFGLQQDIYLTDGNDTIPCGLFHFERAYDLTNARTFVLGFPNQGSASPADKILVIEPKDMGLGPIKIKIEKAALATVPGYQI